MARPGKKVRTMGIDQVVRADAKNGEFSLLKESFVGQLEAVAVSQGSSQSRGSLNQERGSNSGLATTLQRCP
jgi:hypothetical protein